MVAPRSFERDLEEKTPDEFEQLVHRIVRKDHPGATKIKAPDFGADVIADPDHASPWVLQVKHYPRQIAWAKCEQSLDRAASEWKPRRVTFVFPQDLTGSRVKTFERRLRKRRPGIHVDRWTASDLNSMLDEHPDIRCSFFDHRTDPLHTIMRAAQLTERPGDADALLEHGLDLADLVNELDPHFTYELRSRAADVPEAVWLRPPFMKARITGPEAESILSAWSRPEADEPRATWTFTDDDLGESARERLYRGFAAGETVELTEGFQITTRPAPRAMAALIEAAQAEADGADAEQQLVTTPLEETVSLEVEIEGPSTLQGTFTFKMRPVPPHPEHQGAWIGHQAGVLLYVGYWLTDDRTLNMHVSPMLELTSSAGENAMAVQSIIDVLSGPLILRGEIIA